MSSPYVGEIRMFAGNFAPLGWAFCNGALVPISENDTLFNLIGTTYGGDGQNTFNLPNLQGRVPIHMGGSHVIGAMGGVEQVTLTVNQIPAHTHPLLGSTDAASTGSPSGNVPGSPSTIDLYRPATTPDAPMNINSLTPAGASQPHSNMQPYLCVSFIISLFGIYPSQT